MTSPETFTPAVERAAELLIHEAETTGLIREDVRNGLAAALDVEEMARVMGEHPDVWTSASGWKCAGCGRLVPGRVRGSLRAEVTRRHQARSIRDALLGADS